jgi:hypothetical protein
MSGRAAATGCGVPAARCRSRDGEPVARGGSGGSARRAWALTRCHCASHRLRLILPGPDASTRTPVGDGGRNVLWSARVPDSCETAWLLGPASARSPPGPDQDIVHRPAAGIDAMLLTPPGSDCRQCGARPALSRAPRAQPRCHRTGPSPHPTEMGESRPAAYQPWETIAGRVKGRGTQGLIDRLAEPAQRPQAGATVTGSAFAIARARGQPRRPTRVRPSSSTSATVARTFERRAHWRPCRLDPASAAARRSGTVPHAGAQRHMWAISNATPAESWATARQSCAGRRHSQSVTDAGSSGR